MTALRTAAQQALEALEGSAGILQHEHVWPGAEKKSRFVIAALRAALAQQAEPRNQCGETCERAKLCATCAQALAQQAEPMEPVAWVLPDALDWKPRQSETVTKLTRTRQEKYGFTTSLYTAPPQRTMVPLTEEEINRIDVCIDESTPLKEGKSLFARAIENASWEKNHGQA